MFRKVMLVAVLQLTGFLGFLGGAQAFCGPGTAEVSPSYQVEVYAIRRCSKAIWQTTATFGELKEAQAALEAAVAKGTPQVRLVVPSKAYQVQTRGCSRSPWRTTSTFKSREEAEVLVNSLVQQGKQARLASFQVLYGSCKSRRQCVVCTREAAAALKAQLIKDGCTADSVTLVDETGEW